jgi:hypothetical protein
VNPSGIEICAQAAIRPAPPITTATVRAADDRPTKASRRVRVVAARVA